MLNSSNRSFASNFVRSASAILVAASLTLPMIGIAEAKTTSCKVKILGGAFKGRSMNLTMKDGKFVGQSGLKKSTVKGCRVMKYFYGRWYNLCEDGKMIVFKRVGKTWQPLKPKSNKKYAHNCF